MLRRTKENVETKPSKGFGIKKEFPFFKRKFYFNFELKWEKNK